MIARSGDVRRRHLRICALAMGLGDKAVSLLYERVLRKEKQLDLWVERCKSQIAGVLEVLEKERAAVKTPYWFGERIGHADIAVACVLRLTGEAHPELIDARYPALKAHSPLARRCRRSRKSCSRWRRRAAIELGGVGPRPRSLFVLPRRCARTCVSRRPNPTLHGVVFAIFAGRVRRVPGVAPPGGQPRFQAFARIASGVSGCASGCAFANSGSAIAVSKMRFTVGQAARSICCVTAAVTWPTMQISASVG